MSSVEFAGGPEGRIAAELLRDYAPPPGRFDELIGPDGRVRPQWQGPLRAIQAMGEADRRHARELATRALRENGVTTVAPGDARSTERPWALDLFPQVIEASEWLTLECGLKQRARLLDAIVADLYGEQRLLRDGLLPPALVYGNPQFLRPCHGIAPPGGRHLHFLAFDLARAPDGSWRILADRTQAPSGVGFALENRVIASRCLPELFAQSNVRRLAAFFRDFSENLLGLSRRDDALAVVLSPGPGQATYFEHAYLARYLGYTIVEGSDLTVRDQGLFLKTIEGLKPVDVVLRRIGSEHCDPLELQTESLLGVPGLLQAAREGQVAIANALGSGVAETPALLGFLPAVCQALLGEALRLPSAVTWWGGDPQARARLLERPGDLLIRRLADAGSLLAPASDGILAGALDETSWQALESEIRERGHGIVGQEILPPSTTPVWSEEGGLVPAPMTLRVYVTASGDDYLVMPGGLTRVSLDGATRAPWLETGDLGKDTWVLSDGPAESFSLLKQAQQDRRVRRRVRDLPSRAADNLFWLGRYVERSEEAVRLLRSLVSRLCGDSASADPLPLERVVALLVAQKHLSARRARRTVEGGFQAVERELWTILFDPDCPDGLARILDNARRTAGLVRERLSMDSWQIVEALTEIPERWRLSPGQELDDALHLLREMIQHLAAINGMVMENMTRGFGWRFLDMGRRIERVRNGAKLLRDLTARGDPDRDGSLDLLLELADSTMTYRTRYMARPHLPAVLDLLLADEGNPRSVLFQLATLDEHLAALPKLDARPGPSPAQKTVVGLRTEVLLADVAKLAGARRDSGLRADLDRLLRRLDQSMEGLSDLVAQGYFSHSLPRQVSGPQWIGGPGIGGPGIGGSGIGGPGIGPPGIADSGDDHQP